MLQTLDFTGSKLWAPFNFCYSTALIKIITCTPFTFNPSNVELMTDYINRFKVNSPKSHLSCSYVI